tara:strand:+ start:223 stop:3453 length:3231 start_codon:yes stop_codon:yes gene_type:complete
VTAEGEFLISEYLDRVIAQFKSGQATEHSYRPALNDLFQGIDPTLTVINEPKQSEGGVPDFMFQRDGVPIGWAEAKDIDKDVIKLKGYSVEQRKRYEAAYPNLIYTNGVDFEFIREGVSVHFVSIADFVLGLRPVPEKFDELERQLRLFAEQKPISIRSASKLADMMAAKAAIIKDEVALALKEDPEFRSGLGGQFKSFKANLLPKLEPDEFADLYAETITYGMFAARFHDDDLATFSRQEAMEKLPASNPFLKGLFEYVAGPALPKRLTYIVDDLVQVMRASDPQSLFRDFGHFTARNDPFIHFYEDFLAAYNPKKRKSRGVWYTPEPVVDFIVRAVDDVLKTEFGLADGLADTSKVTVDWDTGQNHPKSGKPVTEKRQVHKVQILDPATGTGTFLAKAVQLISDRVKERAPGKWSGYVEQDLLPRLHGFELLMASYAMCHMKLDMQLTESGYKPSAKPPRLSVWLTNSLEPAEREVRDLFFQPLAEEARGASAVKRQTPIMCVIGNPPYSGISQNNGSWITNLIENYKYVDGQHFGERKHWLQDDYVKFIRMAEHTIAQNPSGGVLGFITNHGYLDNPTFRAMRWHLLKTFDSISVLDLHGNTPKRERAPDGGPDKNVFDIQQGVSVVIAVKGGTKATNGFAKVRRADFWGSRESKYDRLWTLRLNSSAWENIKPNAPFFMFAADAGPGQAAYNLGVGLDELLPTNVTGIVTARDSLVIDFDQRSLVNKLERFRARDQSDNQVRSAFFGTKKSGKYPAGDTRGWKLGPARQTIANLDLTDDLRPILYRPFDVRQIYYRPDMVDWGRERYMRHFADVPNLGLIYSRQAVAGEAGYNHVLVTPHMFDNRGFYSNKGISQIAPLYLHPQEGTLDQTLRLNFDPKLYVAICKAAGIDPADQARAEDDFRAATGDTRPSEVKVFDYIYGVLHSPDYRSTYAEFLKIDFPRIPYPPSPEVFRHVSDKGEALRRLHLMEAAAVGDTPYPYHGEGDDVVAAGYPKFEGGQVHINPDQYFDSVPEVAWSFYIGGYQPAQKWLKDRRGRTLSWDDIGHYQKIIKILAETDRIMREIKLPIADEG